MQYSKRTTIAIATAAILVTSLFGAGSMQQSFAATVKVLGAQLIPNENDLTIDSITLFAKGKPDRATGVVEIFEDGELVGSATIDPGDLHKKKYREVTVQFSPAVEVDGDFKVQVTGKSLSVKKDRDSRDDIPGYYLSRGDDAKVKYDLRMAINSAPLEGMKDVLGYESDRDRYDEPEPPASPPKGSGQITVAAFRMPSTHWGSTFQGAAQMYFIIYDSSGRLVASGLTDEAGKTITGLKSGDSYWVWPQDCNKCHEGEHDVRFNHWEDGTTGNPRAVVATDSGITVQAYYEYIPGPNEV